jgi:hypothetical protein
MENSSDNEGGTEPLITITTSKIKDGRYDDFVRINREIVEAVKEHEPRLIAMHVFVNDQKDKVTGIQVHPDADSMEFHLEVMKEKIGRAMDFLEVTSFQVLGTPGPKAEGMMSSLNDDGTNIENVPLHVSGFTRITPNETT